jgi:hypothetical protein
MFKIFLLIINLIIISSNINNNNNNIVTGSNISSQSSSLSSSNSIIENNIIPIIFLHFHKAGGTSFCNMLQNTRYKTHGNCGCGFLKELLNPPTIHKTKKITTDFRKHNNNNNNNNTKNNDNNNYAFILKNVIDSMLRKDIKICSLEKVEEWNKLINPIKFHRGLFIGKLVTSLRNPWERAVSNYERDYSRVICINRENNRGNNCLKNFTIEKWSQWNSELMSIDVCVIYLFI